MTSNCQFWFFADFKRSKTIVIAKRCRTPGGTSDPPQDTEALNTGLPDGTIVRASPNCHSLIIVCRPPRLNTAETFLKQFYAARNLEGPNGQPLYRYHISPSEFDGLRDLLSLQLGDPTGGRHRIPPSVAMSFCLWAAEWWQPQL